MYKNPEFLKYLILRKSIMVFLAILSIFALAPITWVHAVASALLMSTTFGNNTYDCFNVGLCLAKLEPERFEMAFDEGYFLTEFRNYSIKWGKEYFNVTPTFTNEFWIDLRDEICNKSEEFKKNAYYSYMKKVVDYFNANCQNWRNNYCAPDLCEDRCRTLKSMLFIYVKQIPVYYMDMGLCKMEDVEFEYVEVNGEIIFEP